MLRHLPLAAALLATACASIPTTPTATPHVGESPTLNTVAQRSVGEVIYEIYNYRQLAGVRLKDAARVTILGANWSLASTDFLAGFSDSSGQTVYCTTNSVLHLTFSSTSSRVCLIDKDNDGKFDHWKAPDGPSGTRVQAWNTIDRPLPYVSAETSAMGAGSEGFRYELIYEGISGAVVSILYREFVNDLARPAFQQDLHYTLQNPGPTEVSFRSTRLRIHSADNNAIQYEVLSGLHK